MEMRGCPCCEALSVSLSTPEGKHVSLFLPKITALPLLTVLRYTNTRNKTSDPGSSFQMAVFIEFWSCTETPVLVCQLLFLN